MAAHEGNSYSSGITNGKGRMKSGDINKLLNLWNGSVKIENIKFKERVIKKKVLVPIYKEIKNDNGKKIKVETGKRRVGYIEEIERSFASGYDSFAYSILTGDRGLIKNLIDKLYADQRNITVDDITPPTREKLKELGNNDLYKLRKQLSEEINQRN